MPQLQIGHWNPFTVARREPDGYILEHPEATLRLPDKETSRTLEVGERLEAFVYIRHREGLAITLRRPYIDVERAAFVRVVEKKEGLGVFVDIGLDKDMLVSKDYLPPLKREWPAVGDRLLCRLKVSANQMVAVPVRRFALFDAVRAEEPLTVGETLTAYVVYHADEGLVLFTEAGHEIFVYRKHTRHARRLGEAVEVTITTKRDDLRYNGRLTKQKESMIDEDARRILDMLESEGRIPYTDRSDPEMIFSAFHMSKAAFKRALGRLYKAGYVELKDEETILKKECRSD